MKKILLFLLFLSPLFLNAATVTWTGGGDGITWNDAANWDMGVPTAADHVVISSSSVTLSITTTVLSVEITSGADLIIASTGVLNLGSDGSSSAALYLNSSGGTITNDGTINVTSPMTDGIWTKGLFTNNGTITITGPYGDDGLTISSSGTFVNNLNLTIDGASMDDVGINVNSGGGTLTNNAMGVINVMNTNDEAIFLNDGSTVNNFGSITTNNVVGGSNNGFEVRGTFNNNGTYKAINSGGDAIRIEEPSGTLNNAGTVTIDGFGSDALDVDTPGAYVDMGGVIEIGCLSTIGEFELDGTMNLGGSCINLDIAGTGTAGTDYDYITHSNGTLTISSTALKLDFGAYVPTVGDCFTVINGNSTSTTVSGAFASVTSVTPGITLSASNIGTNDVEVCVTAITVAAAVPTLGEWGLIFLALLMLTVGMLFMAVPKMATTQGQQLSVPMIWNNLPFDSKSYFSILPIVGLVVLGFFTIIATWFGYEWTSADPIGVLFTVPLASYMLMLVVKAEQK